MQTSPAAPLRFTPSRVEGLAGVSEVAVFPDRIELTTPGRLVVHRFADIVRRPGPWWWRLLDHVGVRPRRRDVADRDWFHDGPDMFFEFYTRPRIKVYMPLDEQKESYGPTWFVRIQNVIRQGGFNTSDLG